MELMALKNNDYLAFINTMDEKEILPDVPKILDYLIEVNQPIALGSASKNARAILKKVKILGGNRERSARWVFLGALQGKAALKRGKL